MLYRLLFLMLFWPGVVWADGTVTVYSLRQTGLMRPIIETFTRQTGIDVSLSFFKDGVLERLALEKNKPRADLLLTSDMATLLEADRLGLLQPYENAAIAGSVPEIYRGRNNVWVGLTQRARIFYVSGDERPQSYAELADARFRGQICIRPMLHPYNIGLVSALYSHWGESRTLSWLQAVRMNLARPPAGNDREQVRLVYEGVCTVAIGNSYYYGLMLKNPEQKAWADSVDLIFPRVDSSDDGAGTHVNISGIGMIATGERQENALKLVAFLASRSTQELYAESLNEYPVNPEAPVSALVASWGELRPDLTTVVDAQRYRRQAVELIAKAGF